MAKDYISKLAINEHQVCMAKGEITDLPLRVRIICKFYS